MEFSVKSSVKPAPNFKEMHNSMFKKIESIDENRKRHDQRAKLLLSGRKPAEKTAEKRVVASKFH